MTARYRNAHVRKRIRALMIGSQDSRNSYSRVSARSKGGSRTRTHEKGRGKERRGGTKHQATTNHNLHHPHPSTTTTTARTRTHILYIWSPDIHTRRTAHDTAEMDQKRKGKKQRKKRKGHRELKARDHTCKRDRDGRHTRTLPLRPSVFSAISPLEHPTRDDNDLGSRLHTH